MARVAVALGSNLGDRERTLHAAVSALAPVLDNLSVSSFFETDPVGVAHEQPRFLNAAAVGETMLPPRALLNLLLAIEQQFGRERPYDGAPRTLDLDLILYDDEIIDEPALIVPHPRFRERMFVLEPLAQIAGNWRDPVSGRTIAELRATLVRS